MIPRGDSPVASLNSRTPPTDSHVHDLPVAAFRAVVCLGIVAAHFYVGPLRASLEALFGPEVDWAIIHVRFGYESFFVLAGFFLAHSFRPGEWDVLSLSAFFRRRLLRVAVPFWVAVAVGLASFELSAALRGGDYTRPTLSDLWPLLVFVQDLFRTQLPSAGYWFMAPLFQFYLLWGLTFWLIRRLFLWRGLADYHNRAIRVMTVITGVAMVASLVASASGIEFYWSLAINAMYLSLGCMTYWVAQGLPVRGWVALGWVGVCVVGVVTRDAHPFAACVSSVLLLWMAVARPRLPNWWVLRGLAFVGERSYSIYLTHTYIGYRVLNLPTFWGGQTPPLVAVAVWLGAVAASVAFGCVFFWLVERPLARLSRSVRYRAKWETPEPARPALTPLGAQEQATHEHHERGQAVRMI